MIGQIISAFTGQTGVKVVDEVGDFIDSLHYSDQEKAEMKEKAKDRFTNQVAASDQRQTDVNAQETKQGGILSRWRSFIGWVCGCSLALCFGGSFLFSGIVSTFMIFDPEQVEIYKAAGNYFKESTAWVLEYTTELIFGMLGLGVLRTAEKFGRVQNKH